MDLTWLKPALAGMPSHSCESAGTSSTSEDSCNYPFAQLMQSVSESTSKEAKQLLDFTKRQQQVHAESFSEMKAKIEEAMKVHDDYIKVSQTNISLTAELQDYKKQTRVLVDEMRQKDEEIGRLRHSVAEGGSDVSGWEWEWAI